MATKAGTGEQILERLHNALGKILQYGCWKGLRGWDIELVNGNLWGVVCAWIETLLLF